MQEIELYNSETPVALTSSTDATPIVVTKASHGLVTGDKILIYGHATNVAANGLREVTKIDANTFSLQNINTHANIAGSGAGAGANTGFFVKNPKVILCDNVKNVALAVNSAGTATLTLRVAISNGRNSADMEKGSDIPNFGGTVSDTNPYTFADIINLEDGSEVEGDTGIAFTGTDYFRNFELNTNIQKWLCVFPTAYTSGSFSVKALIERNILN